MQSVIYRVETARGYGMYEWGFSGLVYEAGEDIQGPRHPTPNQDQALSPHWMRLYHKNTQSAYYFGFATLSQLRSWIYKPEWMHALHERELAISLYLTTDNYIGDTQAIFRKQTATKIGEISFAQLLEEDACQTKELLPAQEMLLMSNSLYSVSAMTLPENQLSGLSVQTLV